MHSFIAEPPVLGCVREIRNFPQPPCVLISAAVPPRLSRGWYGFIMLTDLRFALRMLAAHPWFSAAIVATLALGIGVNTTVFTFVNAALYKPVALPRGDRFVTLANQDLKKPENRSGISYPDLLVYQQQNRTLDGLEGATFDQAVISEEHNPPERYSMARTTAGLFSMLHVNPVLGRLFTASDATAGAPVVVLIGHSIWKNRYASDRGVIGRSVHLNGTPATIIGVMPPGFRFPTTHDIWVPLTPTPDLEKRSNHNVEVFGVRKSGVSVAEVNRDVSVIGGRLAAEFPVDNRDRGALVRTFHETYNGDKIRVVFLMMLGAVGFVLLIACANVANMMLSRALSRSREIALRAALGAARWQIVRQLLVESVLLSVLGGLLGLGLTVYGVHAFDSATQDVGKPYWVIFELDYVVFIYFAIISVATGVVFGIVPALRASRVDLNSALKDGAPSGGSQRGGRLTGALVVFQFALTVVLLASAGMMVRSFFAAQTMNQFVQPQSIFTARIHLPEGPGERYSDGPKRRAFYERLLPIIAALPGVTQAAITTHFPGMGANSREIEVEGHPNDDKAPLPTASFIVQSKEYLPAIHLPILFGRGFVDTDGEKDKEAAVVSREFAEKFWPNVSAVGQHFRFVDKEHPAPWMTVVGVCANMEQDVQAKNPAPLIYVTHHQEPWGWMGLLVRSSGDPGMLAGAVRGAVQNIDPDLPLFEVRTLPAAMDHEFWFLSVFGTLFLVFALAGLLMASVGIYAVVAQTTARRTREIGIRMALGATRGGILRLVVSRGIRQLLIGLAIGLVGAFLATKVLGKVGFLIGISPRDPFVFIGISVLLAVTGVFACWVPARRAAMLHPLAALREE